MISAALAIRIWQLVLRASVPIVGGIVALFVVLMGMGALVYQLRWRNSALVT